VKRLRWALAAALLACSPAGEDQGGLDFGSLPAGNPNLAPLQRFAARDGSELSYRHYASDAPVHWVLLHGSSAHSPYLSDLAAAVAAAGVANVYTPDLRGHGPSPDRRGDIDYTDQLGDDVADLIARIRERAPGETVIVGGHSSGGGLAIRIAGGNAAERGDAYVFLAPFLRHDAPTTRPDSGGWARPQLWKIVPLSILHAAGVTAFEGATVLTFDLPPERRTGAETPAYSFRMINGCAPRDHRADLAAMCEPALLLVGSEDEAFYAQRYAPLLAELAPHARVDVIPGVGHLGLVSAPVAHETLIAWLRALPAGGHPNRCG